MINGEENFKKYIPLTKTTPPKTPHNNQHNQSLVKINSNLNKNHIFSKKKALL